MTSSAAVVEEHRGLLFSVAYRMLGRASEAEDAVQEALLRWTAAEQDAIDNPRAWLVTVLTRHCIDRLRSAREQREAYVGPWLPEPLLTDDRDPADEAALGSQARGHPRHRRRGAGRRVARNVRGRRGGRVASAGHGIRRSRRRS